MSTSTSSPSPAPPAAARHAQTTRLTFSDHDDRSLSPPGTSAVNGRYASPSPGASWRNPSAHSGRATSKSRLLWHGARSLSTDGARSQSTGGISSYDGTINTAATSRYSSSPGYGDRASSKARKAATDWRLNKDIRASLPPFLRRFTGYRDPASKPPHPPLPFPPFSWLQHIPLQYEVWLLSTIGSFVGIALIEIVNAAGFPDDGIILIVASFGASAVLCFGTVESPLAQPRHLVGGQVFSAILAVAITRLFRLASGYQLDDTTRTGELNHVVWLNGALSMALSLLLMHITGTVHPPGGATAIIASVQPAAVAMSWRFIYVVLISSLVMLGWAMIINNVGRRRYPTYWISGSKVFVKQANEKSKEETLDHFEMDVEEGITRDGYGNADQLAAVPENASRERVASFVAEEGERGRSSQTAALRGRQRPQGVP